MAHMIYRCTTHRQSRRLAIMISTIEPPGRVTNSVELWPIAESSDRILLGKCPGKRTVSRFMVEPSSIHERAVLIVMRR